MMVHTVLTFDARTNSLELGSSIPTPQPVYIQNLVHVHVLPAMEVGRLLHSFQACP